MAYWKNQGWFQSSPINKILENENATLTDVFEQDDILSEAKSNKKLIDFLKKPSHLQQMIKYLTEKSTSEEENIKYKYPWIVAELLSNGSQVFDSLIEEKELFEALIDYVYTNEAKDANNFLTNYVCKVISFAAVNSPTSTSLVIEGLKAREEKIDLFFDNIENNTIIELLIKIVASDISDNAFGFADWLIKVKAVDLLIAKFVPTQSSDTHENVHQFITSVIAYSLQVPYSPLFDVLKDDKTIAKILEILQENDKNYGNENITKLSALRFGIASINDILQPFIRGVQFDLDSDTPFDQLPAPLITTLLSIPFFISSLKTSAQKADKVDSTFGKSAVPLGSHRMQIIELAQTLFATRYLSLYSYSLSHHLLHEIFDLFFEYQWNNILQIAVFQIVQNIFESNNETFIYDVLNSTKLHDRMAKVGIDSADAEKRPGIMGVITKLAFTLQLTTFPSVQSLLDESIEWEGYIHGDYQETKKKENTPIGQSNMNSDLDPDDPSNEEMKIFQSRTKRNFEITFPDDFAVGDFDDNDLEIYFLPRDEKQFVGINTDEDGMDIFEQLV